MSIPLPPKRRRSPGIFYYDTLASVGWLDDLWKYRASGYSLIAANSLPLIGVLLFGWDTFTIVFLYWAENVIIGAINVLKMLTCAPAADLLVRGDVDPHDKLNIARMQLSRGDSIKLLRWGNQASKLFFIPFFVVHYGLFCFVHGAIIFELFGRESGFDPFGGVDNFTRVLTEQHLWLCLAALAASHLVSFFTNYIGRGEYRRTAIPILMFGPYPRIIILHIAVLIGAFIAFALGSNFFVLLLLIIGKTILDLVLHLAERSRQSHSNAILHQQILPVVLIGEAGQTSATQAAVVQSHPPLHSSSGD
jgi:hypothetical protein